MCVRSHPILDVPCPREKQGMGIQVTKPLYCVSLLYCLPARHAIDELRMTPRSSSPSILLSSMYNIFSHAYAHLAFSAHCLFSGLLGSTTTCYCYCSPPVSPSNQQPTYPPRESHIRESLDSTARDPSSHAQKCHNVSRGKGRTNRRSLLPRRWGHNLDACRHRAL